MREQLGGPSTIELPKAGSGAAGSAEPAGPQWVQSTPAHEGMAVNTLTATLVEDVLAVPHPPAPLLRNAVQQRIAQG